MATRRKPINSQSAKLNYRPSMDKSEVNKGTKPTTDPTSILEIMTLMVLYVCKKILFYDIYRRIAVYLGALFLLSLISDVGTIPKSYLSRSDNIFNQLFVKFAWAWNLLLIVPYVYLTCRIYCCGLKDKMVKHHFLRIFIATFFWWFWTNSFNFIESSLGKCSSNSNVLTTKQTCLKAGKIWNGFDISGHSFILIYGSLFLIEETRSIVNWDAIKEHLRLEDHYRISRDTSYNTNPLKSLTKEQFLRLQLNYEKNTGHIRSLFVCITTLILLWDFMLFGTILYYHVMVEKLLGGILAVFTWFITYKIWYPSNYLPKLPGDGVFKYMKSKNNVNINVNPRRRTGSIVNGHQATFMGRPLYPRTEGNESDVDDVPIR